MVGEILNGRYEILKSVGFGGMAEVYLAKDVLLDRKIAIKVLRKKFLDSKTQLEQFKREARSAARLIHPSIVTIYDVCDEGDSQAQHYPLRYKTPEYRADGSHGTEDR